VSRTPDRYLADWLLGGEGKRHALTALVHAPERSTWQRSDLDAVAGAGNAGVKRVIDVLERVDVLVQPAPRRPFELNSDHELIEPLRQWLDFINGRTLYDERWRRELPRSKARGR
jgi:hypothetical protein